MCRRLLLIAAAITASIEAGSASYHPGISSDYSGYPGFPVYPAPTSSETSSGAITTPTTNLENVCRYNRSAVVSSSLILRLHYQKTS